jgi:hypothetical protein
MDKLNSTSIDTVYRYHSPGSGQTYKRGGGVVMYGGYSKETGKLMLELLPRALGLNLTTFTIETVTYAPNIGVFVWTTLLFDLDNAGGLATAFNNKAFRLRHYAGSSKGRIACEVLFILFVFYYCYKELLFFVELWEDQRDIDEQDNPIKTRPEDPKHARCLACFYIDPNTAGKDSIVS